MAEETPTLEGKEQSQPAGEIDIEAFMGELQKVNVTSVEDLKGKLNAGNQAGHLANLLGEVRKENQELKDMLRNMQSQPAQKVNLEEGGTINLEDALERTVTKVLTKKEQEAQARNQKIQHEVSEAINSIIGDEDYPLVKDVWEKKMTPDMIFKIQNGQVNLPRLYQETVRGFYKTYLKQSQDVIMQLTGKGKVEVPYVESGEQKPTNLVSQNKTTINPATKRLMELKTLVDKGKILSSEEELEMTGLLFNRGKPK